MNPITDGGRSSCWCGKKRKPCSYHEGWDDAIDIYAQGWDQMRVALLQLNEWDMLTLGEDGRGAACGDAQWARDVIGKALGHGGILDTRTSHEMLEAYWRLKRSADTKP